MESENELDKKRIVEKFAREIEKLTKQFEMTV